MARICIIGAGAPGLCCAVNLQQTFPRIPVTIIADKFNDETTSFGAGGLFRPNMNQIKGDTDIVRGWITDSWRYFDALAKSPKSQESGIFYTPGFVVYNTPQDDAYEPIKNLVYDYHTLSQQELQRRNLNYKYGYAFTSVLIQPPIFLKWLMKKFLDAGGKVRKQKINKLDDLCNDFDVIINCCGLNAKTLVKDKNIFPVKGQLVHLKAPWMKFFFLSEDDIYVFPQTDKIIVGGTRETGNADNTVDPNTTKRILSRAEGLFPQLKGAEVIGEWTGLRPAAELLRVETEVLDCGAKGHVTVIHNYGHGGNGITLSWGCSSHVMRLLRDILNTPKSSL